MKRNQTRTSTKWASKTAALLIAAAAIPGLSGCWNGYSAQTGLTGTGGNGANVTAGTIEASGLTWVKNPFNDDYKLSGALTNNSTDTEDVLLSVTTQPTSKSFMAAVPVPPSGQVVFSAEGKGIAALGLKVPTSSFVKTELNFRDAGTVSADVLTVPLSEQNASIWFKPGEIVPMPEGQQAKPATDHSSDHSSDHGSDHSGGVPMGTTDAPVTTDGPAEPAAPATPADKAANKAKRAAKKAAAKRNGQ